jgi:outer membrane receptor protein involved in Fe transport
MKRLILSLIFLLIVKLVSAQSSTGKLISVNFQKTKVEQFVDELETKSGYHFYVDTAQFDSLKVTLQADNQPLEKVLSMAFANTPYRFSIIPSQMIVFLTRGRQINTQLALNYSTPGQSGQQPGENNPLDVDNIPDKEHPTAEAKTENKLYEIGPKTSHIQPGTATLSGYVKDIKSGEAVVGATIFLSNSSTGVATDQFGYYTIKLPKGRLTLTIHGLTMRDTRRQIILYGDGRLNIEMQEQVYALKEVKISADKVRNVRSTEMGVDHLDIKSIKQVPAVFGEPDILRVVLTLPGVQSVGEATTGFNVRGGSADQNLILLNGSTIYNPSHFFGFFSAFDPELVKDVQLYKSSIPEQYGGRLASVLDVTDREGNKKTFTGSAGIGLLTSRLNIEGPLGSDKTSFIIGARTSYSDWLLSALPQEYKNSSASFYDVDLGISHQINEKNSLYLNGYLSHDAFRLNSDTTYSYGNRNANIKWKHNFNDKLFSLLMVGYDRYQYEISSDKVPINGYTLNYNINQSDLKYDFTYYLNRKNTISFGLSSIYYKLNAGDFQPFNSQSLIAPQIVPAEQALESALYLGDKYDITPDFTLDAGVRLSIYNYLGPATVDHYAPNLPRTSDNVVDSTTYTKNQIINTYINPEIRVSARYGLDDNSSLKASYNTMTQYLHLISNTTAISPTDVYKLSDPNIKPQTGKQVSLGYYRNAQANTIETSVEVYYKWIGNYLDYKSGATLLLNDHIEQETINTDGKAYGIEFLVKKTEGKLNGWMSYTYSRTFLRQDDPNAGELINNGDYYPANYDKPNDFNFTGNYRFTHRYSVSLNVVYSTGRPITLPESQFYYGGGERVYYGLRNANRIPDYFRSDFSINIEGNHKVHQLTHNSWSLGVYNLTGRANAYSTYFTEQGGAINGYQLSIFAKPIPFINYNIRF